jgi:Ribonuclease G/E
VTRILARWSPGEIRVVVARNQTLLEYAIWRPGAPDGVGDVYRGRVISRVDSMAGAFISLGQIEGFLPDREGGRSLHDGDLVAVSVTRAAQGGKGPRLALSDAAADGPIGLVRRGPGAIERLAALYPEAGVVVDSRGLAASLKGSLGGRVSYAPQVFTEPLESELAALEEPVVEMARGGRLSIHPTPALVAIDVDAGSTIAGAVGKAPALRALNRWLIPALAQQIRLRNLAGAILIDFAGLSPRQRTALAPDLAAALAVDRLRPRLLGFTALGLAEIVRPRIHPPLHELLAGPHAAALAALREAAQRLLGLPGSLTLRAAPTVIDAIEGDPVALADLAHHTGRSLMLRSDPSLAAHSWSLEESRG